MSFLWHFFITSHLLLLYYINGSFFFCSYEFNSKSHKLTLKRFLLFHWHIVLIVNWIRECERDILKDKRDMDWRIYIPNVHVVCSGDEWRRTLHDSARDIKINMEPMQDPYDFISLILFNEIVTVQLLLSVSANSLKPLNKNFVIFPNFIVKH